MSAQTQTAQTVLVVGSTGNIGIAAIHGALRAGYNILAVVRNDDSAKKIFQHVPTGHEHITIVVADVTSDTGVKGVVDQVRAGSLPAFQHVYATAGGLYPETSLLDSSIEELRELMKVNFESNVSAYLATVPYLLEQKVPASFTICTGAQGDIGLRALPAMSQGALYSMSTAACKALKDTNVRFNEVYLNLRVEVDAVAEVNKTTKSSAFGQVYANVLAKPDLKSTRVWVTTDEDLEQLRFVQK